MNQEITFTPLEESVSFYTRNDFAIINSLLTEQYDKLWQDALLAYNDNRGILEEYATGIRTAETDYELKWIRCLNKRLIETMNDAARETIVRNARSDLSNLLSAMHPATARMTLYRTAWVDVKRCPAGAFPYSREYPALTFAVGDTVQIQIITSCSMTPYRETDGVGSPFYRYCITVPDGFPVLELDPFETHNEDGEVLLPPMEFRLTGISPAQNQNCLGILHITCLRPL